MEEKISGRGRSSSPRFMIINRTPLFYGISIFFFSACALFHTMAGTRTTCLDLRCSLTGKAELYFQEFEQSVSTAAEKGGHVTNNINMKSELKTKMARRRSTKGRTNYNRRAEAKYYYSVMMRRQRRYLSGPGSSPPRCTGKCGKCTPCKPVHVPVPPGTPVTTEYYPEAWRCKCGNKLYMP
ncbi:polygalacturonase isoform X1 [Malania oleifera]|uniref:polygalacturonase isoform X1 n=1 Tax=Malania oleifera TaxID=397392 RepID=UPI0025AE3039|nr:polygalacturonase isoform X1 [Malania oleifera]